MNDEALANMFPSMAVTPTAAPAEHAPAAADAPSAAEAMFPSMTKPAELPPEELSPEELSPEVQALRADDPARRMFTDETVYGSALDAIISELEAGEKELVLREWSGILGDLAVSTTEAENLVGIARQHAYPTVDQEAGWCETTIDALNRKYGDGATSALADAKLLVARDPRLHKFLHETGLGSHPDIVLKAVEIARAQLASGKLKRKAAP